MHIYNFLGKKVSGLFTIPSGIVTTAATTLEKFANEIPEIGILTTKSIGLEPCLGNREPIIAQVGELSFANAVGLANPGAVEFAKQLAQIKIPVNKFLLISIFGQSAEEFIAIAKILLNFADGFELNISCPHSAQYGQVVGQDNLLVEKIVNSVVCLGKPVLVKISPNLNYEESVKSALRGGAAGITAINTKGPEVLTCDGYPILSNTVGGLSGKAVLDCGLQIVIKIRSMTTLPLIACGGISTAQDVKNYQAAGANWFGVGSALVGMTTEEIKEYFHKLADDVDQGTDHAAALLKKDLKIEYKKYKVKKIKWLAQDLFLLELDGQLTVAAGQFIFAWLPTKGEKPFAIFDDHPLTLLIKKRGCFTTELAKLKPNDFVYVRGPYGNSPKITGTGLLVGGGTGMAALYLFAKSNKKMIAVLGAKNKESLPYLEKFKEACQQVYFITETGGTHQQGLITDILEKVIQENHPDFCLNCGSAAMVQAVIQKENKYINPEKIYSAVDFLTKCGVGLCGSCATTKGYRNCVDGTFLKNNQL